ncbi:MAG: ExeM/NucH family extracellular endonuclease [Anaerolineales bacterium]|nr:MAG: ExeM/NucH family extracellular endonuclease [Anaerolineales bacterium]
MNKLLPGTFSLALIVALLTSMVSVIQPAYAAPRSFDNPTSTIFINEIHYDNTGTDAGESIEIAGPAGTDLTGWSIILYNASNGAAYDTDALSGIIPNQQGGYGTVVLAYPSNGIQNGSPDGIALANGSTLVQFLSYEGSFAGVGGVANGVTSTDIGVSQAGTEPLGSSLQLTGAGDNYGDFTWTATTANTFGNPNTGQSFSSGDTAPSVSSTTPANGALNVAVDSDILVNFSEDVAVSGSWFDVSCGTSGAHTAVVSGGPQNFTLNPDADFANSETCTVTVMSALVSDTDANDPPDTMSADYAFSFNTVSAPVVVSLVINEIDYDQPSTDTAEFVEIKNTGASPVNLDPYSLVFINGNGGATYDTIDLPNINLAAGDYFVVCANTATVQNCDLDDSPDTDFIQNGAPDAVALMQGASVVDTVSYEGNTGAPYTEGSGVGLEDPGTTGSINLGISRLPDGTDTNQNNVDLSARCITPGETNSSGTSGCVVDVPPTVATTNPTNGAVDISVSGNIDVNFSEAVTVTGNWFTISCANTGAHTAVVSGGPQNYTLDPDVNFGYVESCSVTIVAANVADQDGTIQNLGADYNFNFTTAAQPFVCGEAATFIHDVQGSGLASPLDDTVVTIEGVVVGSFQGTGQFGGFHVQEEDADADANPATSEGIFVYNSANTPLVGDRVRIQGTVDEFNSLTELKNVTNFLNCASGNPLPTAATLSLPVTAVTDFEAYEGMRVTFPQALVISEYFNFDQYGEIVLTSERHLTPTAEFEPGSPEQQQAVQDFLLDKITLDDGRSVQNPDPALHPNGNVFDLSNLFRGGSTVANVTGVMDYSFGLYRIQPTQGADYVNANPRTATPEDVGGRLRIASMNTLNFFLTLDYPSGDPLDNKCGPLQNVECRGADSNQPLEFTRQHDKLLAALTGLNADVIGLNELENTLGVNPLGDPNGIVEGLNAAFGAGTYAYIDTGVIGTDAIRVGLVYKTSTVAPVGNFEILDSTDDPLFLDTKSRPSLAQTFEELATGERFTVVVNHFKSKGSACTDVGDPDLGDGQGNCSQTRKNAAIALVNWLATDPTNSGDPDFLIMGDLNSYDKEESIDAIRAGGFTDLAFQFHGEDAYSYVFDGQTGYLDYALANNTLLGQVTGMTDWHINSDEPDLIDYDTSFKKPAQDLIYAADPYRSSDHDPVVVGLNLLPQCHGKNATIYVDANGKIVGGLQNGQTYYGTLIGSAGDDVIVATGGNDTILALGGNDTVCALGGNDVVFGGMGNDTILGGAGHDVISGDWGNDTLYGEEGKDTLFGADGADVLDGGLDKDVVDGGSGADSVAGGDENDVVRGGSGNDALDGGAGNDACNGGSGTDTDTACEIRIHLP